MQFTELQNKLVQNLVRYGKKHKITIDEDFALFKLFEEVGELSEAILTDRKKSRPIKHVSKEEFFKDITEKVARTIWLNPEEERYWYTQTNVTLKYKPYCDELVECATLDQLSTFVRNLVI